MQKEKNRQLENKFLFASFRRTYLLLFLVFRLRFVGQVLQTSDTACANYLDSELYFLVSLFDVNPRHWNPNQEVGKR